MQGCGRGVPSAGFIGGSGAEPLSAAAISQPFLKIRVFRLILA